MPDDATFEIEFAEALEASRRFLLSIANAELPAGLQAKGGASDLVQETFAAAHEAQEQFRGKTLADLRAWLRAILHNEIATFRRHYVATAARDVSREAPSTSAACVGGATPVDRLIAQEQERLLATALARLPDQSRQAVVLRIDGGHSFAEIGADLGKTEEAARKLFTRALLALRDMTRSSQEAP